MENREFYQAVSRSVREHGAVQLYTVLTGDMQGRKIALSAGGTLVQEAGQDRFWEQARAKLPIDSAPCFGDVNGAEVVAENLVRRPKLIICGGGHISQPLAQIGAMLEFEVTVIDDREEYANRQRFPQAHQVLCMGFSEAFRAIGNHPNTYYVIVTRGHADDRECLELALKGPFTYVGMIGSKAKVAAVMKQMREDGYPQELLEQVYSPIGLKIGAQTPVEIAVCITAEMIQVRRSYLTEGCMEDGMLDALENHAGPMVMATIVSKKGSAPRSTGAKMLMDAQGKILSGSTGGGAGEGQVCAAAPRVAASGKPELIDCNMTNDDAKQAGMICGGVITVFLEAIL